MFRTGDRAYHKLLRLVTVLEDQRPGQPFLAVKPDVRPVTMVGHRFNADVRLLSGAGDALPGTTNLDEETAAEINRCCSSTDREANGSHLDEILRALLVRLDFTLTVAVLDEVDRI